MLRKKSLEKGGFSCSRGTRDDNKGLSCWGGSYISSIDCCQFSVTSIPLNLSGILSLGGNLSNILAKPIADLVIEKNLGRVWGMENERGDAPGRSSNLQTGHIQQQHHVEGSEPN